MIQMSDAKRPVEMLSVEETMRRLSAAGMEGVETLPPPRPQQRFRDRSVVIVIPTKGLIDYEVTQALGDMTRPANARVRGPRFAVGYTVHDAYNEEIREILSKPELSKLAYVLTVEDDNIVPRDGLLRLLETMEAGPPDGGEWSAVSGLYHTKELDSTLMLYGDPRSTQIKAGHVDFTPVDPKSLPDECRACSEEAVRRDDEAPGWRSKLPHNHVLEVNGIPMGFALWRLDLFRQMPYPWFHTLEDEFVVNGKVVKPSQITWTDLQTSPECHGRMTQDLFFCLMLRRAGKRVCADLRVQVGHKDVTTGRVY